MAVLLCPGHDYSVDTAPGTVLAFVLEPSLLQREIDLLNVRRPGTWSLQSMQLRQGRVLAAPGGVEPSTGVRAYGSDGQFLGLVEVGADRTVRVERLFVAGASGPPVNQA